MKKLNALLQGDLFMKTEVFKKEIEEAISDLDYEINFEIIDLPYPIKSKKLEDKSLPSGLGLGWDGIDHELNSEVGEFTGELDLLEEKIKDKDVLFLHMAPITKNVLNNANKLKYIGSCRGGVPNINLQAATDNKIIVCNAPGRNAIPVAEFTVGLLISHVRYIARGHESVRDNDWKVGVYREENSGIQLRGSTLGIVGFGAIGKEIAYLMKNFGIKIISYDPYQKNEIFNKYDVEKVDMDKLLKNSDIVVLATKLSKETLHLIGEQEFNKMKNTAHIINAARGGLIDYKALYKALKDKKIAGAALDVFDPEPPLISEPLLKLDNVTFTPHIAAASKGVVKRSAEIVAEEFRKYLTGNKLTRQVNKL